VFILILKGTNRRLRIEKKEKLYYQLNGMFEIKKVKSHIKKFFLVASALLICRASALAAAYMDIEVSDTMVTQTESFEVRVIARNQDGTKDENCFHRVTLGSDDEEADLPSSAHLDAGERTFNVTLNTPGSRKITVHNNDDPTIDSAEETFDVIKYVDYFHIEDIDNQNAGEEFSITVTARHKNHGNALTFSDQISIQSDNAEISPDVVSGSEFSEGEATFEVTLYGGDPENRENRITITNTERYEDNPFATGESNKFNVVPGEYEKLVLLMPGEELTHGKRSGDRKEGDPEKVTAGHLIDGVEVRAVDEYFNPVTSGPYPEIEFITTDEHLEVSLPEPFEMDSNKAVFDGIRLCESASNRRLTIRDTEDTGIEDESWVEVKSGGLSYFDISHIGTQNTVTRFTVEIVARDLYDNRVEGYDAQVSLKNKDFGPDCIDPNYVYFDDGVWGGSVQITRQAGGGTHITVDSGTGVSDDSNEFIVEPGSFSQLLLVLPGETHTPGVPPGIVGNAEVLTAGEKTTVTVKATDDMFNTIGGGEVVVPASFEVSNGYYVSEDEGEPLENWGGREYEIKFRTAGNLRMHAYTGSYDSDEREIRVEPGEYENLVLVGPGESLDPGGYQSNGKLGEMDDWMAGQDYYLEVAATDEYWNPIDHSYPDFVFDASVGGIFLPQGEQKMSSGHVENYLSSATALGTHTIEVEDVDDSSRQDDINITVISGPVDHYEVNVDRPEINKDAGEPFNVEVKAKDRFGNVNEYFDGDGELLLIKGSHYYGGEKYGPVDISFSGGEWSGQFTSDIAQEDLFVRCRDDKGKYGDSEEFTVEPGSYDDLLLLFPGQSHTPAVFPGKTGSATPSTAGEYVSVKVLAVDEYFNKTGNNQPRVRLRSDRHASFSPDSMLVDSTGKAEFNALFREAGTHIVTASDVNDEDTNNTDEITIEPGDYSMLQIILPGEIPRPGSNFPDGKEGSPVDQVAGLSFDVVVKAVDSYWNRTSYNGGNVELKAYEEGEEVEIGSLDNDRPFVDGATSFDGIFLSEGEDIEMIVRDTDDLNKNPNSSSLDVRSGNYYLIDTPEEITAGEDFTVDIQQIDHQTDEPDTDANHEVEFEVYRSDYSSDVHGELGIRTANLSEGTLSVTNQRYDHVEDIRIRISDSFGRQAYSDRISVVPSGLKYVVTAPTETAVGPPNKFNIDIELRDSGTDNVIRTLDSYVNPVSLSYDLAAEAEPVEGGGDYEVASTSMIEGRASVRTSYTKAESIIIRVEDSQDNSGQSNVINFVPDGYQKLQLICPGETPHQGSTTETGKTGEPDRQDPGRPFHVEVRAVDRYWNLCDFYTGGKVELDVDGGDLHIESVSNSEHEFENGRVTFNISLTNPGDTDAIRKLTASDGDDRFKSPQTSEVPVSGTFYEVRAPSEAVAGENFEMEVELLDVEGKRMSNVSNNLYFRALKTNYEDATGELASGSGFLNSGIYSYGLQRYAYSEDIIIKVEDDYGRKAYSDVIEVRADPSKLKLDAGISHDSLRAGEDFHIDFELIDTNTSNLVRNMDREIYVMVYPSDVSSVPDYEDAPLKRKITTDEGIARARFSGYERSEIIEIKYWDSQKPEDVSYIRNILVEPGEVAKIDVLHKSWVEPSENEVFVFAYPMDSYENKITEKPVEFSVVEGGGSFESNQVKSSGGGVAEGVLNVDDYAEGEILIRIAAGNVIRRRTIKVYDIPDIEITDDRGLLIRKDRDIYAKPDSKITLDFSRDCRIEGSRKIYYRINNGEEKPFSEPFSIDEIGKHVIEYYYIIESSETETEHEREGTVYVYITNTVEEEIVNYPNPFSAGREETFIEYSLMESSDVEITIYNLVGEEVWSRDFVGGEMGARKGINIVEWDGRNKSSSVVGNGGYICRVYVSKTGDYFIRKIAVVK